MKMVMDIKEAHRFMFGKIPCVMVTADVSTDLGENVKDFEIHFEVPEFLELITTGKFYYASQDCMFILNKLNTKNLKL